MQRQRAASMATSPLRTVVDDDVGCFATPLVDAAAFIRQIRLG